MQEFQELDLLEASSQESLSAILSKPPSSQVAMDCPTALESYPMVMAQAGLVAVGQAREKLATPLEQELVLQPLQPLKQPNMVLAQEDLGHFQALGLELEDFLASEALLELGPRQQLQPLLKQPSTEPLEA